MSDRFATPNTRASAPVVTVPPGGHLVVQGAFVLREDLEILQLMTGATGVEPVTRAQCDAYRLYDPAQLAGVAEACGAAGYDWALVPHDRPLSRVRLVAMDLDSTLITIEGVDEIAASRGVGDEIAAPRSIGDEIAASRGIGGEVAAITAAAMRGEIDVRASLERRVALLAGLPVSELARVYHDRLRLSPGAERLLATCSEIGAKTLLVSGGFTFFTDRLRTRLALDHTLSNVLEIAGGRLTGKLAGEIIDADAKAARFAELAARYRGHDGIAIAIGDGANDVPMLAAADVSIAYRANALVRAQAMHAIDHCGLDAVLNLFA